MICRKNILKLFVQEFNIFLFCRQSEELQKQIMKKHGWTEEQFNTYHQIFMEELENLPEDNLDQSTLNEFTPHEYLMTLISILDTPVCRRHNSDDINLYINEIQKALNKGYKLQ